MNISIRDEVYRELKRRRGSGESFSDVLERLLRAPSRLSDFAGAWSDLDAAERREIDGRGKRRAALDAQRSRRLRARQGE